MSNANFAGEKKGHIYYISINRPEKRNAISFDMLTEIAGMIDTISTDRDVRVIVLRGEGKMFSSGVDLMSLGGLLPAFTGDAAAGGFSIRQLVSKGQQCMNMLENIEIPIICAIHNRIQGMAVELSLACDFRLMSDDCTWGLQETKFGLIPDLGGNARLSRIVGAARAMEINMTGKMFTAQQALQWGLVSYVYPAAEFFAEVDKFAQEIASTAPLAAASIKRVIRKGLGVDFMTHLDLEAYYQSIVGRSEDFKEGISAMLEKRAPNWKGK